MKPPKLPLALQVRLQWLALLLVFFVAAVPAAHLHPLSLFDANNQPASPISLAGAGWTDQLDPARLPNDVPLLDDSGNLIIGGDLITPNVVFTRSVYTYGGDPSIDLSDPATGFLRDDGLPSLSWTYGAVSVPGTFQVQGSSSLDNGSIFTNGGGEMDFAGGATSILSDGTVLIGGINTELGPDGSALFASSQFNIAANGNLVSQGYGNFGGYVYAANGFNSGGNITATSSISMFGASATTSQPARPTTQAGIIDLLVTYGLCH